MNEYPPPPPGQYPQQPPTGYPGQQPMYPQGQYPQQPMYSPPPAQPPKKKRIGLWITLGVIAVLLCTCAGFSSLASKSNTTNTATLASTQAATATTGTTPTVAKNQHFKVGQTAKIGDTWQITLNSVQTSKGQSYSTPKTGNVYLLASVTMKNISSKEQAASSLLDWRLRDTDGEQYSETIVSFAPNAPGGSVEPGGQIKGTLPYEVPADKHKFTLAFKEIFSGNGQTIWDLSI